MSNEIRYDARKGEGSMLTKLKWIFGLLLFVTVFGVLHYNLPQRDIVRITGTEVLRKDFSNNIAK